MQLRVHRVEWLKSTALENQKTANQEIHKTKHIFVESIRHFQTLREKAVKDFGILVNNKTNIKINEEINTS